MFEHAGQGYAGSGTLCGALGVSSYLINMVLYDNDHRYMAVIDQLMKWYSWMQFPTERFDHLSRFPKQVQEQAMTPLCHTSVSKWALAAGVDVNCMEKYERCAKVAGEVVHMTVHTINEYLAGKWVPAKWEPSEETSGCLQCHGPEAFRKDADGMHNQMGQMDCMLCHEDHA